MNIFFVILIGLLISFFGFYLRIRKKDQGVDSWYYLSCVREFKRSKIIPVKLPNYLLDIEEQWYPPGFVVFLSIFPFNSLKKYRGLISPLIDALQLAIVYFFAYFITHSVAVAVLSGIIYALAYTLIVENSNLNSRGFGSLLFSLTLVFLYEFISTQNIWWLVAVLVFGFFLLMSHKMAVQALMFLLFGFAVIFYDWRYLAILAAIFLLAFVFSKGFYLKILKGHKEILIFWKKNLVKLRAHQIYHSSIYQGKGKKNFSVFHQEGISGFLMHTKRLIGHNPWIVFIIFLALPLINSSLLIKFLFSWLVLVYFLIALTTYFSPFRFLGEGYKYIKFAIFPQSLLIGILVTRNYSFLWLFIFIALISLYVILKVFRPVSEKKNANLEEIIKAIKESPRGATMCLPANLSDIITFFTKKKVLWGTHSSGWDEVEDFFPVLKKPVEYFFEKYNLNFLLLAKDFVEEKDLRLSSNFNKLLENTDYLLFEYKKV